MKTQKRNLILTLFLIFMVGCITGWIYEMGFYCINDGHFIKRGQGYGSWLPIYGFGTLAITVLFYNKKESPVAAFLGSALVSGGLEFAVGWLMFHLGNGLRLWDYNVEIWNWGNLGGDDDSLGNRIYDRPHSRIYGEADYGDDKVRRN